MLVAGGNMGPPHGTLTWHSAEVLFGPFDRNVTQAKERATRDQTADPNGKGGRQPRRMGDPQYSQELPEHQAGDIHAVLPALTAFWTPSLPSSFSSAGG